MKIDREFALSFWEAVFGKETLWAQDCFGTWMYKHDYGITGKVRNNRPNGTGKSYDYGWSLDHIKPQNSFANKDDANFLNNLEPMHHLNNSTKNDKLNFKINNIEYSVCDCDICRRFNLVGFGIKNKSTGKRVDWKGVSRRYYG